MKKNIAIENRYLLLPVIFGGEVRSFSFYEEGRKVMEFAIPVDPERVVPEDPRDFYGALPVSQYVGRTLTIEGQAPEAFFEGILKADEPVCPDCPRPYVHFSPMTGWMNDPNGLVFDGSRYQMYFQHNPFGKPWNNMTWGHASSADLMHWDWHDEALLPDELGTMFSGSGMPDRRGVLGKGSDALAFFYTAAGKNSEWSADKPFVQCLAYSVDGGMTMIKDGIIIENFGDGNRDPKVYYHEKTGKYYLIMFVEEPCEFAIFNSTDLKHWTETQRLLLPGLRECPDLRQIPVRGEQEAEKYLLTAADGTYMIGTFDGRVFTPETGVKSMFGTRIPYAAQTFNGPERVILVPWLRTHDPKKPYTSTMGLPRELVLEREADGELTVTAALDASVASAAVYERKLESAGASVYERLAPGALELVFENGGAALSSFAVKTADTEITYDAESGELTATGIYMEENDLGEINIKAEKEAYDPQAPTVRTMREKAALTEASIFVDRNVLEITLNGGREVWIYELIGEDDSAPVTIETAGVTGVTVREYR